MNGNQISPEYPPLPTPTNLPFQPSIGSHTSNAMFESDVGAIVPLTRQNAGNAEYVFGGVGMKNAVGGVYPPAGTTIAALIFVSFRSSDARLSHVPASAPPLPS